MSTTETLDRGAAELSGVDAAKATTDAALSRLRRRAQDLTERAQTMRTRAQTLAERAQELSARAQDFAARAPDRARREIARRRSQTAARLETLAEAIRPDEEARAGRNRKTVIVAGGSTAALVAALGLGVALGFYLSRGLKTRAAEGQSPETGDAETQAGSRQPPQPDEALSRISGVPH